ncbi:hypothetical protein SHDE107825_01230 [Shewanella denitrificans]
MIFQCIYYVQHGVNYEFQHYKFQQYETQQFRRP